MRRTTHFDYKVSVCVTTIDATNTLSYNMYVMCMCEWKVVNQVLYRKKSFMVIVQFARCLLKNDYSFCFLV